MPPPGAGRSTGASGIDRVGSGGFNLGRFLDRREPHAEQVAQGAQVGAEGAMDLGMGHLVIGCVGALHN